MIRAVVKSRELALLGILLALFTFFAINAEGFLDPYGLFEQMRYWFVPGLLAIPMTFIIATAGIDLSVGSMAALAGIVLGMLFKDAGLPAWLAAAGAVAAGSAAGAFNGLVIARFAIPPLVVTLATMTLFRGLAMGLSQARAYGGFPADFHWISRGDVFTFTYGDGYTAGFPVPVLILVVVALFAHVLLRKSWIGRHTECLGENETAARFAAIDVARLKFGLYAACGAVAGVAACFQATLADTAKADAGAGLELEAIACVVLGGTRISGGHGSIFGTLLGLCIIGILRYGLDLYGLPSEAVITVVGVLLIATAVFNEWAARRQGERS